MSRVNSVAALHEQASRWPKMGHPGRFTGQRVDGSDKQMFGAKRQVPHGSK